MLLRRCLVLRWRSLMLWGRSLMLLRRSLAFRWGCLMLLGRRLVLLLRRCLVFLHRRGLVLLHRSRLMLGDRLMLGLLMHGSRLVLLLSRWRLVLLHGRGLVLRRGCFVLRDGLMLWLLLHRRRLVLRLHGRGWPLLLRRRHRTLLLLGRGLIVRLQRSRSVDVAVGRERLADDQTGRAAMVDADKLSPIGAGCVLILQLRPHGWSVLLMAGGQFSGSGSDRQATLASDETDTGPAILTDRMLVDVVHDVDVNVVDRAIVIKMTTSPITALITDTDIAEAVVHTAIVADVRSPIATVETVPVIVVAPVAWSPQSALVGGLNPHAGHPIIAALTPCPIAGSPEIIVSRSRRLFVVG